MTNETIARDYLCSKSGYKLMSCLECSSYRVSDSRIREARTPRDHDCLIIPVAATPPVAKDSPCQDESLSKSR